MWSIPTPQFRLGPASSVALWWHAGGRTDPAFPPVRILLLHFTIRLTIDGAAAIVVNRIRLPRGPSDAPARGRAAVSNPGRGGAHGHPPPRPIREHAVPGRPAVRRDRTRRHERVRMGSSPALPWGPAQWKTLSVRCRRAGAARGAPAVGTGRIRDSARQSSSDYCAPPSSRSRRDGRIGNGCWTASPRQTGPGDLLLPAMVFVHTCERSGRAGRRGGIS